MDLFDAPIGVDPHRWGKFLELVAERDREREETGVVRPVTTNEVIRYAEVSRVTAGKFLDLWTELERKKDDDDPTKWVKVEAMQQRGRPMKAISCQKME